MKWNPGDYDKLVSAALLTATVPDVFEYAQRPDPGHDQGRPGARPDRRCWAARPSQFSKPVLDAASWEGKVYGIPQTVDMQMLFYRKSVLSKAGVEPPTTMDELITAAKAVTTKDMGGFFAGNDGGAGVLAQMLIWAAGPGA